MRWQLLAFLPVANACWLYSKDDAIKKIQKRLGDYTYVDREMIHSIEAYMPKAVSWAVEAIGVDTAFKDCDANNDGKITIEEMKHTDTCMSSCAKLAILNAVL